MVEDLIKIINNLEGNILITEINNENIIKSINENKNIKCYLLNDNKEIKKKKIIKKKKLIKLFAKNKINEVICNYYTNKDILDIIPSKFYLNGKLYLYGYINKYEIEKVKEKYSYYTKNIVINNYNNETLIIIGSRIKNKEPNPEGIFSLLVEAVTSIFARW